MELIFANGTSLQKLACRTALNSLINLPLDHIQFKLTVEFTPDPLASSHNEFAATSTVLGSSEALTKIASVAPDWPIPWDGVQFLQETMAHEFGHALFAALSDVRRLEIAEMFGATTSDQAELAPPGAAWEDKINEGVAETFKDAFLPPDLRRYYNRTHHKIPIGEYGRFRQIFREGVVEISLGGELEEGEVEVPGFPTTDLFALGEPFLDPEEVVANYLAGTLGRHGLWSTNYFNLEQGPLLHNSQMLSFSAFDGGYIKEGTVLSYSFTLHPAYFLGTPYYEPKALLGQYNDSSLSFRLVGLKSAGGTQFLIHAAAWSKTVMSPEIVEAFGGEPVGEWGLYEEAMGGGAPTTTFSRSVTVNAANFPNFIVCHGDKYRYVGLHAVVGVNFPEKHPETEAEHENLRQQAIYPWIPSLNFTQAPCGFGEGSPPIVLPTPSLDPESLGHSRRRLKHRVSGLHLEV